MAIAASTDEHSSEGDREEKVDIWPDVKVYICREFYLEKKTRIQYIYRYCAKRKGIFSFLNLTGILSFGLLWFEEQYFLKTGNWTFGNVQLL